MSAVNRSMKVQAALDIKEYLFDPENLAKPMDDYIPAALPHFFSNCKPEKIEEEFMNYLGKENMEYKAAAKKYKLKFTHSGKREDGKQFAVQMTMRIYKHSDK